MKGFRRLFYFKACPRCHGDMHVNRDIYGGYRECLQCGHMDDIEDAETKKVMQSWARLVTKSKRGGPRKAA